MPISPRASPIGLPALRASSTASASRSPSSASASRCSSRARSARRDRAPGRERGLGARDRGVGLLDAGARQLGEHLLGRGLEDGQRHRHLRLAVGPRLGDQRGDQRRGRVGLRVPLHAEREPARRVLDRLGQVVDRRPAGDLEALAEAVDALVVVRLRARGRSRPRRARRASRGAADVVVGVVERARRAAVVLVADGVGQVLDQRPAARDVHHLHAAADAEQRQVALERAARQRELERVALGHRPGRLRMRLGAVGGRVDVGAAGEQQAVDAGRAPGPGPRPARGSGGSSSASPPARLHGVT